jgi:shikimate dehydrogenase
MRVAAIFGHPVGHSRSPLIHGYWLKQHGLSGAYVKHQVPPEHALETFRTLADLGLVGGNATIPHKEALLLAADEVSPAARAVGAANTMWIHNGRLCVDNTDVLGFLANVDACAPGWDVSPPQALVLGAGGAARAILYALTTRGVQRIILANRSIERAKALAEAFGPTVVPVALDQAVDHMPGAGLLVNSTSLGMKGQPDLELDLSGLPSHAIVVESVYIPLETSLLRQARLRGLRTADGLGMLLHQAVPGFERWFGVRPVVTPELRAMIVADIGG